MSEILPYKTPGPDGVTRTATILRHLRLRETWGIARIVAGYALGVPLSFFAPMLLATILTHPNRGGEPLLASISWNTAVLLGAIVLIPLLYWYELRTRGEYFMDALRNWYDTYGSDGYYSNVSTHYGATDNGSGWIILMELFLFGPRLVIASTRALRERSRLGRVPLDLAAATLERLLDHDGGIPPADLVAITGDPIATRNAILYLAFHEWVDLSKDRRRIWALTQTRKILGEPAHA